MSTAKLDAAAAELADNLQTFEPRLKGFRDLQHHEYEGAPDALAHLTQFLGDRVAFLTNRVTLINNVQAAVDALIADGYPEDPAIPVSQVVFDILKQLMEPPPEPPKRPFGFMPGKGK